MTILVGYPIKRRAKSVLQLAAMLARSGGEDLKVCIVQPARWMPGMNRADQEYRDYLAASTESAIAQAKADLPSDVTADFSTVSARSTSSGLLEVAADVDASVIVVGSSEAGHFGHVTVSSVADRLLHSSPIPVAIAPRGYDGQGGRIERVTLAYTGTKASGVLLVAAETLAGQYGAPLRLASFAVKLAPPETALFRAESAGLTAQWTSDVKAAAQAAREEYGAGRPATEFDVAIGHGENWKEAFDDVSWKAGEVLVVGSSESGPVSAVFLGSRATKIVRYSPVPVIAVPRGAAEELAAE